MHLHSVSPVAPKGLTLHSLTRGTCLTVGERMSEFWERLTRERQLSVRANRGVSLFRATLSVIMAGCASVIGAMSVIEGTKPWLGILLLLGSVVGLGNFVAWLRAFRATR
jgi:hypothetical protein